MDAANIQIIADVIIAVCGGGGVLYLIIDKLFGRKKDNAETATINQQNNMSAIEIYKTLDEVVQEKLDDELKDFKLQVNDKILKMNGKIEELDRVKCYRTDCELRIKEITDNKID